MNAHTVLLVDDEKVIREGCQRAFAAEGFRVLTASNGREALEALTNESVDAILCDLKMPVMGAMGVLEQVMERHAEVPGELTHSLFRRFIPAADDRAETRAG